MSVKNLQPIVCSREINDNIENTSQKNKCKLAWLIKYLFSNMQCDCEPRDDQSEGCGDDCANKMLMIECSNKDCLLENKCGNKR